MLAIFVYEVRLSPESRDPVILQRASEGLKSLASILAERVADGPWLGGDDFTFADIACGHILHRYFTLNWERPDLPELKAYYERLQERPAYRDHAMVSYEELRGSY